MPDSSDKQPMQPPFDVQTVSIDKLDLDLKNSRFPRDAQSQTDAFQLMMATAGDQCMELLRDLTQSGQMNSSDLPIVVEQNGRFVVMEGNRRLTCLLIWRDVERLSKSPDLKRSFHAKAQRLIDASVYAAPSEVLTSVAPNEGAADRWIEGKHTGEERGAGVVAWGAAMKDRRKARHDPTRASRAMAFVDLVSTEYEDDPALLADLETVRTARYSFIQRFVDRGVVREKLGLEFAAGKMSFKHGSADTKSIIAQALSDFAQPKAESGKTWARELDTVDDFTNYLERHSALLPSSATTAQNTVGSKSEDPKGAASGSGGSGATATASNQAGSSQGTSSSAEPNSTPQDTRPPRPTPPRDCIFRSLVLDKCTNRIQEIVRQTSMLSVHQNGEIVAALLRVILELTTYQYLKSNGHTVERSLDRSIKSAILKIEPTASNDLGQAEDTSELNKAFHRTTANDIRLVQYAVHDLRSASTPSETLILADRYEPVLVAMNANMGSQPLT